MADTSQWHYTNKTGQQAGPVPTDELLQLIASKQVPPSSMAWKDGMATWKPVSQIEELQTKVEPKSPTTQAAHQAPDTPLSNTAKPTNTVNPYETPRSTKQSADVPEIPLSYDEIHGIESYEGIGRLSYILLRPLLYIIIFLPLMVASLVFTGSEVIAYGVLLVYIILFIRLHCLRFTNIGMSPWWTLALIVPLLNLPLYLMLNICPAGFSQTRKLDLTGKILAFFVIGIPILIITLSILTDLGSSLASAAEKAQERVKPQKQEKVEKPSQ